MQDEDRKSLIKVRLEHAEECLQSAKELAVWGNCLGRERKCQ